MTTAAELLQQGWNLHQSGDLIAAEAIYRQVLASDPENANAWCYLGMVCFDAKRLDESIAAYRRAVEISPQFAVAHNNLGNTFRTLHRYQEAIASYNAALRIKPEYVNALVNRATALLWEGDFRVGIESASQALSFAPQDRGARKVLATAKMWQGELVAAVKEYRQLLVEDDSDAEIHKNLSMILLLQGNLAEGWREYQWRHKMPGSIGPHLPGPCWDGSSLDGKTILLVAEQGLGDTIQFIRYAQVLKSQYRCRVIALVQQPLQPLLQNYAPLDGLVVQGHSAPSYDVWAPLLSVPSLLGENDIGDLPCAGPYLKADDSLVAQWRDRLSGLNGFRVGIAWQGNPQMNTDRFRSVPLHEFLPLAKLRGIQFISLQRNHGLRQLETLPACMDILSLGDNFDVSSGPFMDTAAVMANLDLVITSDTAIAHLAGALGVKTWVALAHTPDWRWFLRRDDSPWYPSLRLFRQPQPGDWGSVLRQMAGELPLLDSQIRPRQPADYRVADTGCNRLIRARHGLFLYDRNDRTIGLSLELYGEYAEGEIQLFRQVVRPGSTVVEAGANIGCHTVPLARLAGENGGVHAFEPQQVIFQTLCANVALNGLSKISCRQAALGDVFDAKVPALTIDSLGLPHCHFLKANVNGSELAVLRGAVDTIRRCQPVLYVTANRREQSAQLVAHIRGLGYRLFWHPVSAYSPDNWFDNPHNELKGVVSRNMFCIPSHLRASITGLQEVE